MRTPIYNNTKGVIRRCKSKRGQNIGGKGTKRKTMIDKSLYRKLKIEQHEPHYKLGEQHEPHYKLGEQHEPH